MVACFDDVTATGETIIKTKTIISIVALMLGNVIWMLSVDAIGQSSQPATQPMTSPATQAASQPVFFPPNRGFAGTPWKTSAVPGEYLDRYGGPGGSFLSPAGTPAGARSLAPGAELRPLNTYEVLKSFSMDAGTVAPWFNQHGGGIQYDLGTTTVQDLIIGGYLRPVK